MTTLCRRPTRACVPRSTVLAELLQMLEISKPCRCLTKDFYTRQATSPLQALQRAEISKVRGTLFIKLLNSKTRRRHRAAHRAAHLSEPCENGGIVKALRSENVRHDEVVGEAGEGVARVGLGRGCCGGGVGSIVRARRHRGRGSLCVSVVGALVVVAPLHQISRTCRYKTTTNKKVDDSQKTCGKRKHERHPCARRASPLSRMITD